MTIDNFIPKKLKYVLTYALLQSQLAHGKMTVDVDAVGSTKKVALGLKTAALPTLDMTWNLMLDDAMKVWFDLEINANKIFSTDLTVDIKNMKQQVICETHLLTYNYKMDLMMDNTNEEKVFHFLHDFMGMKMFEIATKFNIVPQTKTLIADVMLVNMKAYTFEMEFKRKNINTITTVMKLTLGEQLLFTMENEGSLEIDFLKKFTLTHDCLITMPHELEAFYFYNLFSKLSRHTVLAIEAAPEGVKFELKDTIMKTDVKFWEVILNNALETIHLTVYVHDDQYIVNFNIDLTKHEIMAKSVFWGLELHIKLPTIANMVFDAELKTSYSPLVHLHVDLTNNFAFLVKTDILYPMEYNMKIIKDLTLAEMEFSLNEINVITLKAVGNTKLDFLIPEVFKYDVTYDIPLLTNGKIIVDLELMEPQKKFLVQWEPKYLPVFVYELNLFIEGTYKMENLLKIGNVDLFTAEAIINPTTLEITSMLHLVKLPQITYKIQSSPLIDGKLGLITLITYDQEELVKFVIEFDKTTRIAVASLKTVFLPEIAYEMKIVETPVLTAQQLWRVGQTQLMAFNIKLNMASEQTLIAFEWQPVWFDKIIYELKIVNEGLETVELTHNFWLFSEQIVTLVHKVDAVKQSPLAWKIALENKIAVPKTSFLIHLLEEVEHKMTIDIDFNEFTGVFFKVDFHNTLLLEGQKYLDIAVSNANNVMQLTLYFPTGPQIFGLNLGFKNILGQDSVSVLINADTNDKTFFFSIEKHGVVLKLNLLTAIIMPRLPLIC